MIRRGEVRLARTEAGAEYPLATLGQGEMFGEKACMLRQEQMASVIAVTDVTLLVIPEKTVHQVLERNPKLREVLEDRIRFRRARTATGRSGWPNAASGRWCWTCSRAPTATRS